jgi:para-nitrobenzyl esterase
LKQTSDELSRDGQGRRTFLKGGAVLAGTGAIAATTKSTAAVLGDDGSQNVSRGGPSVIAGAGKAVVSTTEGKVAGYISRGVFTYKGIPYGDTTAGANRFLPPKRPKPWSGERSSRQYGAIAPQSVRNSSGRNDEEAFIFDWDDAVTRVYQIGEDEDCLRLNIWTPGINDGGKRPVMVWLHGGGFANGSGNEQLAYDGESLARRGDVVVVTLNHRLNVFGYLNLSQYGNQYASSANVGMLDIVAALEWIRDNIAAFGGDPGVVTIFGQSGGGSKVSVLMGMPSAKGLFHRGVVESGSMLRAYTEEGSRQLADLVVAELGLNKSSIDRIHTLPFQQIQQASEAVLRRENHPSATGVPSFPRFTRALSLSPVVDGVVLPANPFDPEASMLSADVPMIIGTTLNEFVNGMNHPEYEDMTLGEVEKKVHQLYPDRVQRVISAFRERSPDAKPFDLWSQIAAARVREAAIKQATAKAALGKAPAFLYWFMWKTPILDGRPRAFHCSEIPFVFNNTDRCDTMTGGGPDARALAAKVSDAWIHFARTGDPNHPGIPHWTPFSGETVPTMMFNNDTVAVNNPDGQEQKSIAG